jgi:hypothetical protein
VRTTCTWCRSRLRPPVGDAGYGEVSPQRFARRDVEDEHTVFLKTIIPSRKATKEYLVRSPTMKIDADEKELLAPSSAGSGSPPAAASASELGTPATPRPRFARIVD